jgi:hypothetical protein
MAQQVSHNAGETVDNANIKAGMQAPSNTIKLQSDR